MMLGDVKGENTATQVTLKVLNSYEIIGYTKVPLALVKRQIKYELLHARQLIMVVPMLEHHTWSN
jgi:hypothetical protein